MTKKSCLLIVSLAILLGLMPRGAWAYNEDIHFNLTYVLCRLAGFPLKDALWIADADQSMDENDCTNAFPESKVAEQDFTRQRIWVRNGHDWHAFSGAGGIEIDPLDLLEFSLALSLSDPPWTTVIAFVIALSPETRIIHYIDPEKARIDRKARFDKLWQRVLANTPTSATSDENKTIKAEIAMGQFLHFEQDYFAHRQLTPEALNDDKYLPYGPIWGHFTDKHVPDYVGARPGLAGLMIKDNYKYLRLFVNKLYGKDMAPEIPDPAIQSLILALVQSYHPSNPTGAQPYLDVKKTPTQQETNIALSSALQSLHISSTWTGTLPSFSVPSNVDFSHANHPYRLPYGDPKMLLSEVEKTCIEPFIISENLPN